ncbi:MAG: DegT/DnrJ/EryC1/StrS family aminotransferase [Proteobacteria bacterium]|uniref:DegT/DnrJ/EryC1/StrS family aminotransferase n=1 Tax=Brevundimonas sp. TaxID=1871086 RepID=UPI000DAFFF74|nr:DegT/DnrJ/EryC1/StrS family aminotransferase [Brevundimonas sp.]MCA0366520.1 DegT/DnrJ/EryC1/StrS family aminotransferase [Pseudomonadota bacterium]PZU73213.1 MAG: aminotransferase DegT [Brevundimonas sp.]
MDRIAVAVPRLSGKEKAYVNEALDSTWISSRGPFIERFEAQVAAMAGVKHAIACNNGTTSLHLAMVGLGLGAGDEVIMPSLTYIATANCVRYCNASPVFVDNDPRTFNIDPERIEQAITPRTKGIVVVHLYGQSADMAPIMAIAARYGLWVIEDAAEAHGARYRGAPVGGIGHCGSFSFFGNKIITTGEGGAVTTNDDELAARMRLLRSQGMSAERRYWHPVVGFNYRMTNLTAAIGVAQMERLDEALARRVEIAATYDQALAGLVDMIDLPFTAIDCEHSFWMYTIMLKPHVGTSRDEVMARMDADGVETRPVFYPVNDMPPYYDASVDAPNARLCAAQGINLPTHESLSADDITRVGETLRRALNS